MIHWHASHPGLTEKQGVAEWLGNPSNPKMK